MKTIEEEAEYTLIEKNSKFITRIFKISTEEQAKNIIEQVRKKEKGATHNCFVYRIWEDKSILERKNDDGEPKGTAGSPMLSVITGANLVNVLVITTRYFGGIKLGTGGLVNAYTKGVKEVLKKCKIIDFEPVKIYKLISNIKDFSKIESFLKKEKINIIKKEFNSNVSLILELTENQYKKIVSLFSKIEINKI